MIGEGHSLGTLKGGMSDIRGSSGPVSAHGTSSLGVEEYSGIADEILERIDAHHGVIVLKT